MHKIDFCGNIIKFEKLKISCSLSDDILGISELGALLNFYNRGRRSIKIRFFNITFRNVYVSTKAQEYYLLNLLIFIYIAYFNLCLQKIKLIQIIIIRLRY
ncbi:hypothetical protein BpHYR1_053570 [Brachionus plicatilis]|uniref:Uncharacterized protein n=1 Tax=Brachionus plicatilis TaxID=10195 RepID=A0A3M7QYG5_BRAPC|nr:hypothetical protein BpHYR1_053570 [Brachionus plicatilis]